MPGRRQLSPRWNRCITMLVMAGIVGASLVGCGKQAAKKSPTVAVTPVVHAEDTANAANPAVAPAASADENKVAVAPNEDSSQASANDDGFRPPFPLRLDPFEQPDATQAIQAAQQRVVSAGEQVALKGFVQVDQSRRAMLLLEGKLWVAATGDERGDVAVINITPPEVTLRRQGVEWSLTLDRPL